MSSQFIFSIVLLVPLAAAITYYDVRYRRIPNRLVAATLLAGLLLNLAYGGWGGLWNSLRGCGFAFGLMLLLHLFGALGAGDVKLFAAIGAVIGAAVVWPVFVAVVVTGAVLAVFTTVYAGAVRVTAERVAIILFSVLSGLRPPQFPVPDDRKQTLPYGVAITFGTLLALVWLRP